MRTNKFIPLLLAISLHGIPIIFCLIQTSKISKPTVLNFSTPSYSNHGIDLNGFSVSKKSGEVKKPQNKTPTKTVGLAGITESAGQSTSQISSSGSSHSENDPEPTFIKFNEPIYPIMARKKGYEGKVKIKVFFDQNGIIIKVDIIESSGVNLLDETVRKAALEWRLKTSSNGSFEKTFVYKLNN